ncbi:MAG: methyltransferase domain-containing protein [Polyangiaceae bacterium]
MNERQTRWNDRHARGEETHGFSPSPLLDRAIAEEPPGVALDVACGSGRHAIRLAEKGFHVVALDYAQAGLDVMMTEARRRSVDELLEPTLADIESEDFRLDAGRFDVVCDFFFLHRPLLPKLRDSVAPGGLFVAAIHVESPENAAGHGFLLSPGELKKTVASWGFDILYSNEGTTNGHPHATAEIIARRPG